MNSNDSNVRFYIGLGSNIGTADNDSLSILQHAVVALSHLGIVKVSRLYRSPPMGPQDQPDFLNAVAQLDVPIDSICADPMVLLDYLQNIEHTSGRVKLRHWGERTLDLDILLYLKNGEQQHMQQPRLTIPHVGLLERDFVVLPLLEFDTDLCVNSQPLQQLACVQHASAHVVADRNWYLNS